MTRKRIAELLAGSRVATLWGQLALLCALVCAGSASAGDATGTRAFEFVRLPVEPVGRALSGSHLARVAGPEALAWNPAGLAHDEPPAALLSHTTWAAGAALEWGALTLPLPETWGTVGLACRALRSGALPGYAADGTPTGDFTPFQLGLLLGYGRPLGENWRAGINLEWAADGDGVHAPMQAWALGTGIQWQLGRLGLGLAALHLGPEVEAGEERFSLPATVRVGASIEVLRDVAVHSGAEFVVGDQPGWLGGIEWVSPLGLGLCGSLRGSGAEESHEPAAGLGVTLNTAGVRMAYSYRPAETLEPSHQISLRLPLARR